MKIFEKKGATLIEYAVLAALIIIVAIAAIRVVGQKVSQKFSTVATSL
ncbi:MAG: Flp family type IVb pilin [Candidatus Dadabacteria bacterium]|nr:MAG: Flp family type IVb pilin [Candidatus Dadabacteria bacterium]